MKLIQSMFYSDRVKLTLRDILKLLLGFTIKDGALKIRLWKIPSMDKK